MTNNPWIPHKPGDPMPVDGDCLVSYVMRDGSSDTGELAKNLRWSCAESDCDITAYRIHKPSRTKLAEDCQAAAMASQNKEEREMKYKAGDRVTIVLSKNDADEINEGGGTLLTLDPPRIILHEPAPEPIVGYFNVYPDGAIILHQNAETAKNHAMSGVIGTVKIELSPTTKEVKAEIV